MMRRSFFSQPNLQEPPPGPNRGAGPGGGWTAGSRPPAFQAPVLTYALIAANVFMWLLTGLLGTGDWLQRLVTPDGITLVLLGAKFTPAINSGEYWRLVTATFLHAGIIHLAVNMWALLQLGMLCEILYGRARFLILYVCSGVMGSFASYELSPIMGVGASGAIFGLFGVAFVYSLKYRRDLPPGMGDRMMRSLVPVILLNLALTFSIPIIDKFAHLGGLIVGGLLATITESPAAPPERRQRENLPVPLALLTSVGLLAYGAWGLSVALPRAVAYRAAAAAKQPAEEERAIRGLLHSLSGSALSHTEILSLGEPMAEGLARQRQGPEAEAVYRRLLELAPHDPQFLNGLAYLEADVLNAHLDEAERLARLALRDDPEDPGIIDTLAWVYFKQGKLADAAATQQHALRLSNDQSDQPDQPDLHYHMGAILESRKDPAGARREYEAALRLNPDLPAARQGLARLKAQPPQPAPNPDQS